MLGYRAHREVFLWLETRDADSVVLEYWLKTSPDDVQRIVHEDVPHHPAGGQIHHFVPGLLKMGAAYDYRILIDGEAAELVAPATFQAQELWEWRQPPPDFKFIMGSCAYLNDPEYDRPGPGYGKTTRTYELMGETDADFMLWTGDNWYWREADYSSVSGMWYRPSYHRSTPELQKLLGTMHHYAIWDDHDYGPNDSNWSFEYKEVALDIFQAYWGNHTYGESANPGTYSKFFWGDAAFFLMDNHYYRDAAQLDQDIYTDKSQWGRHQLEWLKQSLMQAQELRHFKFLFIVTGNQVLQRRPYGEPHELYRREREELMDFIVENNLTGVVFLTGDVHHSGMYKRQIGDAGQWVYEITSSPLSSGSWNVEESEKANDPHVMAHTLVGTQNFVEVAVTGEGSDRHLIVTCTDYEGETRFTETIRLADLAYQMETN
jgi:alkaline phosphatase D